MPGELVPFGKYKGQPLDVLAADRDYCEWLVGQDWVEKRFPKLHTIIINNFAVPDETPEHNALQLRFLEEDMRRTVAALVGGVQQPHRHYFHPERYRVLLHSCSQPLFEQDAIDVCWVAHFWTPHYYAQPYWSADGTYKYSGWDWVARPVGILLECKPSLGDDYPAVLRFMHGLHTPWALKRPPHSDVTFLAESKVVIAEQYAFRGGTVAQVQALFQASGTLLLLLRDLVTGADASSLTYAELPNPAHYHYGGTAP